MDAAKPRRHKGTAYLSVAAIGVLVMFVPAAAPAQNPAGSRAAGSPRLVVMLVVDQMRADYVDRFSRDWTGGLKRLVSDGAWFTNAAYPYLNTVTCPGHATIATGAFPHVHGVIQNAWWDREQRRTMSCTEDPRSIGLSYGTPVQGGDSAYRLLVPTLTDRLRAEQAAHVVTLSLKDRAAIMLAGHGADAATWLNATVNTWETSSAFSNGPVPAVQAFVQANPVTADYGKAWNRLLPVDRYTTPDDGLSEAPPAAWTSTFPHVLTSAANRPDAEFFDLWQRSPYADAYLGRFAAALVDAMNLGAHEGTDVLAVSFSSTDLVGHGFGPQSQEVQDVLAHLDRTIGTLFQQLDSKIGRQNYVVALTGDHGVQDIPEQAVKAGRSGGRLSAESIVAAIERRLATTIGLGDHIVRENGNDVYFEPGVATTLRASSLLFDSVIAAVQTVPGVGKAYRASEVAAGMNADDPLLRAAALSYVPGRSGDLIIVPKEGWMFAATGATHATASRNDQRVPIFFLGAGIKPGRYAEAVTPADIAPTLAALTGVTMPQAEGRALKAALR